MHTEPAGDIYLDLDITLFPWRFQHLNQDNVLLIKMLFDEMKCAVERDYDRAQFLPWSRGAVSLLSPVWA